MQAANQQSVTAEEPEAVSQSEIIVMEGNQKVEYYIDGSYYIGSYDGQGNLIKEEWYNADGSLTRYHLYSYDGQGNKTKDDRYNADGSLTRYYLYSYDEQGDLTKFEEYNADGSLRSVIEF